MKNAGAKTKALVELVDVYPTLVDLCGFPVPNHLEGTSVGPVLAKPGREWKSAAFSQFSKGKLRGYALTDAQYRYVEWVETANPGKVTARELYDRVEDPHERRNLVGAGDRSELVEGLSARLDKGKGWKNARPD